MKEITSKVKVLLEALPYIQDFRSSLILIKLGGSLIEDEKQLKKVLCDIVLMECIGMNPIIVHGGGKNINKRLKELSIPIKKSVGLRHSDKEVIQVVDEVLTAVNESLVKEINSQNAMAQTILGKDILKAKKIFVIDPKTKAKIDLDFVGDVIDVDVEKILNLIKKNIIPVITPLATDDKGNIYNINADLAAARIAEKLRVRKLVFLSDVPGLLLKKDDEKSLISTLSINKVSSYIKEGIISEGMQPKVLSAIDALKAGTRKVHFIDGRMEHSLLLELFTKKGIGTEIVH